MLPGMDGGHVVSPDRGHAEGSDRSCSGLMVLTASRGHLVSCRAR